MGLLSSRRITRAVDAAYDALDAEAQEPFAVLDQLDDDERLPALLELTERLVDEEAFDHARLAVERALQLAPDSWEALGLQVQAERHDPERRPQAIAALKRLLSADPGNPDVAADLAMILIENEQAEEALVMLRGLEDNENPVLILRTGEALVSLGRHEEALAVLAEVRQLYNYRLKHGMLQGDAYEMREHMMGAARLYHEVQAELHSRTATAGEPAPKGNHDADDEVDLGHLGQSLMEESTRIARDLELRSPEETVAAAERRLESDAKDPGALALLGSALLRLGQPEDAHARFEAACLADRKCFAGYLGLGAVTDCLGHDLFATVAKLPPPPATVDVSAVVPDWAALTDLERRVVWASVHPLRSVLPALARAGARVRILPIDVRPADLDVAASATVANTRVERLLDVETAVGWEFACEFTRLAYPHLPAAVRERAVALRARAAEVGWAGDEQSPEDDAEFLAGAYADFLRQRHGLTEYREPEDLGLYHDVMALFAGLADRETLAG